MFSRRWLINYLLIILIIIFTWIGNKYPITDEQKIDRNNITSIKAQDVTNITIETADGSIQAEKKAGSWYLTSPINWFGNNIALERLATLATQHAQSTLPQDQIDLATLGLRIPKAVVTLNQQSILFGDTNRIGNRRYLKVNDTVYLVDDVHFPFISQGVQGLLDTRLLPASLDLVSLTFSNMKLRREGEQWKSDNVNHTDDNISQLINNWQTKQASSIKPFNKTLTPLQKISATLQNGNQIEFHVLSIQPEIIIARPDLKLQYHFPDHQYYELLSLDKPDEQSGG